MTTQGMPLGLLTQDYFTRPEDEPSHRPEECRNLPIEEKESYHWLQAFKQTLALAPPGVEVITVCDREADIYEMFVLAPRYRCTHRVAAAGQHTYHFLR